MFSLRDIVIIPNEIGILQFDLTEPTYDSVTVGEEYSVEYYLSDDSMLKIKDVEFLLESYNNCAANRDLVAFMEYYNPGMYVKSVYAFLAERNKKMRIVISLKYVVKDYSDGQRVMDVVGKEYFDNHTFFEEQKVFQPFYSEDAMNLANTFKHLAGKEASDNLPDKIKSIVDVMELIVSDAASLLYHRVGDPRDWVLDTRTFSSEDGIVFQCIELAISLDMFKKYAGREPTPDEVNPIITSFIADILNAVTKSLQVFKNSAIMPSAHVIVTGNYDVILLLDYINDGINIAINSGSDIDSPEGPCATSCKLDVLSRKVLKTGETAITFEFTQNNNIREFDSHELTNIAVECINFPSVQFYPRIEDAMFSTEDAEYICYGSRVHPGIDYPHIKRGTPMYSIYNRHSYLYQHKNDINCHLAISGTVYILSKSCTRDVARRNIEFKKIELDTGVKYRFTLRFNVIALSNSKPLTTSRMNKIPKRNIYEIQYVMDHLYVFSNGRHQLAIAVIEDSNNQKFSELLDHMRSLSTRLKLKNFKSSPSAVTSELVILTDVGSDV